MNYLLIFHTSQLLEFQLFKISSPDQQRLQMKHFTHPLFCHKTVPGVNGGSYAQHKLLALPCMCLPAVISALF